MQRHARWDEITRYIGARACVLACVRVCVCANISYDTVTRKWKLLRSETNAHLLRQISLLQCDSVILSIYTRTYFILEVCACEMLVKMILRELSYSYVAMCH